CRHDRGERILTITHQVHGCSKRRRALVSIAGSPGKARSFMAVISGALLVAGGVMAPIASTAHAGTWRQPGYAASRSAYNPAETTIDAGNVATLVELWRVPGFEALHSPVSAGGRVFVANGDELVALALGDGAELWRASATAQ